MVPLVDEGEALLQIATGSADSPCDVGLMGWNERGNVQSPEWVRAPTVRDAVKVFQGFLAEREVWRARYEAGELDV